MNSDSIPILTLSNKLLELCDRTSYKSLLAFKFKLLIEQLPTRKKLHLRYPLHYPDDKCPRCLLSSETFDHIFSCSANTINLPTISRKIKKTLNNIIHESKVAHKQTLIDDIQNLSINGSLLLTWAKGVSTFNPNLDINHKAKLAAKSTKILYKHIWIPRSTTANTSPNKGIKWKKSPAVSIINQTKKSSPSIFTSVLNSFLLNNSTTPDSNLTNQIIQSIVTYNSNTV